MSRKIAAGALSLLTVVPGVVSACTEEEYPGKFLGNHVVEASPTQSVLVAIENRNTDIFVQANDAGIPALNSPAERNGNDYLFLEATGDNRRTELCLFSSFLFTAEPGYRIFEYPVDTAQPGVIAELQALNEAGQYWQDAGFEDVEAAEKIYSQLSDSGIGDIFSIPGFSADMLYFAALANYKQRRYTDAYNQAQRLQLDDQVDPDTRARANALSGKSQVRLGEYARAEELLEQAREFFLVAVDERGHLAYDLADTDIMLGEIYATEAKLELAAARLDEARMYAQPDFQLLGHVNNNEGYLSVRRSQLEAVDSGEEIAFLQAAVQKTLTAMYFYTEAQDSFAQQIAENNAAVDYVRLGERRKSLIHFSNLIALLEQNVNPEGRAFYFANMSNYTAILGDYSKAKVYVEEAIRLSRGSDSRQVPGYHCRLGTLFRLLDNLEEAVNSHQLCLQLASDKDWYEHMAEAELQLSIDFSHQGKLAEAGRYLDSATTHMSGVDDPNILKRLFTQQGELFLAAGDYENAENYARRSIETPIDGRYFNDHIEALYLAQRIKASAGDIEGAELLAEDTLQQIEEMYAELDPEKLSPAWGNQTNGVYRHLAGMYLDTYLATSEESALISAIATNERSLDPSMRQHLSVNMSYEVMTLEDREKARLFSEIANNVVAEGTRSLPALKMVNYYHQHDLLSLARLNNIDRVDVPAPIPVTDIQRLLGANQLVLYYMNQDENVRLLVIDRNSIRIDRLIDSSTLAELSVKADRAIKTVGDDAVDILLDLSRLLLPELSRNQGVTELLVVGQEGLVTIPFAALSDDFKSYRPLVGSFSIKRLPSLSSYFMDKPFAVSRPAGNIAIFADPVFSNMQLSGPVRFDTSLADLRGWSDTLQPLPFSALEAENIRQRFPGKTSIYTGTMASRENLGSPDVRNAKVLHIATHGYFSSSEEDKLGLALSSVDDSGNPRPGFVTLTELFSNAFNNELVVISGCETALGQVQAGIGMNSLTRGFLVQGVKHVISTLWPVSDRASAAFMSLFYDYLATDEDVSQALKLAQKAMSEDSRYSHPFYWAAYTLTSVSSDSSLVL